MDTLIEAMQLYHATGLISYLNVRVDKPIEVYATGAAPVAVYQPSAGDVYIEFSVEPEPLGFVDSVHFTVRGFNPIAILRKCEQLINAAWQSI